MTPQDQPTGEPAPSAEVSGAALSPPKFKPRMAAHLRAYFLAGILITAPISITIYLALLFINFVDDRVTPLIPAPYNPSTYLPFGIPGLGLVLVAAALTLIGWSTAGFAGRLFVRVSERLLARMPVVRGLYGAVKQIVEAVVHEKNRAFREAVLVEFPRRGLWAIGFVTGVTKGEVQHLTEETVLNVFVPTTPNPTSGFLVFVPNSEIVRLSMTVEDAVKMVVSGGIVTPPDRRPTPEQAVPKVSAHTYEEVDILREKDRAPILVVRKDEERG